jgi:dTDP-4-amino-4,6-dideoxygalactose transaminase
MLDLVKNLTKIRRKNALIYDKGLKTIKEIFIPPREKNIYQNYQLYCFLCKNRNGLMKYLNKFGIDAKIHYPKPMHLQKPCILNKFNKGNFPVAIKISKKIISLPVHEFVKKNQIKYVIRKIRDFYK